MWISYLYSLVQVNLTHTNTYVCSSCTIHSMPDEIRYTAEDRVLVTICVFLHHVTRSIKTENGNKKKGRKNKNIEN